MVAYWRWSASRRWRRRRWRSCCFSRRGTQDTQPAQGIWSRARCCQAIYINPTSGHLVIIRPYIRKIQGWEFALLLFPLLLIIAHFKEQLWAIRSHGSLKKSAREQISLAALYKRATRANRFRHSLKKSDMSDSLMIWANCSQKRVIGSTKKLYFLMFLTIYEFFHCFSPLFCPRVNCSSLSLLSCSRRSLRKTYLWGNCSSLSLFSLSFHALYKIPIVSDLLPSLFKPERKSKFFLSEPLFRSQKTSDSLEIPKSEFPTLEQLYLWLHVQCTQYCCMNSYCAVHCILLRIYIQYCILITKYLLGSLTGQRFRSQSGLNIQGGKKVKPETQKIHTNTFLFYRDLKFFTFTL